MSDILNTIRILLKEKMVRENLTIEKVDKELDLGIGITEKLLSMSYDPRLSELDVISKYLGIQSNPIIDGRIVSDRTFATRFINFIEGIQVSDGYADEEKEYLLWIGKKLLGYQKKTATSEEEIKYLKNLGTWRRK